MVKGAAKAFGRLDIFWHNAGNVGPGAVEETTEEAYDVTMAIHLKAGFFGAKPKMVLKGGMVSWAVMGDPNASLPTPQPVYTRPMFGAFGRSVERSAVVFVSAAAQADGVRGKYGLAKETLAVQGTRGIGKSDMVHNSATPQIEVNPETYEVRANGELLTCEPARELPLAQRYFLF